MRSFSKLHCLCFICCLILYFEAFSMGKAVAGKREYDIFEEKLFIIDPYLQYNPRVYSFDLDIPDQHRHQIINAAKREKFCNVIINNQKYTAMVELADFRCLGRQGTL